MKTFFTIILLFRILSIDLSYSQTFYTWNGSINSSWTNAGNWTPSRSTLSNDDVIIFDGTVSGAPNISNVQTETIGQLKVINSCIVTLTTTSANRLTITGGSGHDLFIEANSTLTFAGTAAITDTLAAGTTGEIYGTLSFTGGAHRLFEADSVAVAFKSGGMFTASSNFTGNAFGNEGKQNRIVFESGSVYEFNGGSNPFGLPVPSSRVIFHSGSLYRHQSTLSPSFSGRTYANFELNSPTANINATGAQSLTINDIVLNSGTLSLNLIGGVNIKGNLAVNAGTLSFNPVSSAFVKFNGTSPQTIANYSSLSFGTNANVELNNPTKISLLSDITFTNNNFTIAANTVIESSSPNKLDLKCLNVINNGADSCFNTEFSRGGTQNISGSGIWKGGNMNLINGTQLNLNADMIFDGSQTGLTFYFESGVIVSGNGILKTNGLCGFDLRGDLNTDLEVESDSTVMYDLADAIVTISKKLIIDNNSVLSFPINGATAVINDEILNNGLLYSPSIVDYFGSEIINNSTIDVQTFNFKDTSSLSGPGILNSVYVNLYPNAFITLESNFHFNSTNFFFLNNGSVFDLNDKELTFSGGYFILMETTSILPSGIIRALNASDLDFRDTLRTKLNINSGTTSIYNSNSDEVVISSDISIDSGATLTVVSGKNLNCLDNVNIKGTLMGASCSVSFFGDSLYNGNEISIEKVFFKDTTSVYGTGQWPQYEINILDSARVKFENNIAFGDNFNVPYSFSVTEGSELNLNSKDVTLMSPGTSIVNVELGSGILNGGKFNLYSSYQTIFSDGPFEADINIKSGYTEVANSTDDPFLLKDILIDSLATLVVEFGTVLTTSGDITVNGDVIGNGTLIVSGDTIINNGNSISVSTLNFDSGNHVLMGTGSFTTTNTTNFLPGSVVTLGSDMRMNTITIENGVTFDITNRKLTLTGGTLNTSAIVNNGNFLTSGSTISFKDQSGVSYIPSQNISYDNIEIDNSYGVIADVPINLSGDIYFTNGPITVQTSFIIPDNSTIYNRNGYFTGNQPTPAGVVNLVYDGSIPITTEAFLSDDTTALNNLTINNPAGVMIFSHLKVNGNLNIIQGDFYLGNNIITLSSNSILTETPGNIVTTGDLGYIKITQDINAPNSLNVGGLGAVLTSSQNLGITEVRRGQKIHTANGSQSIKRYYDIIPANNTILNATAKFYYDESDLNNLNENDLKLYKSTDLGDNWTNNFGIIDTANNFITKSQIQDFSKWTLANFGYKTLQLTLLLEGFYNSASNLMNRDTVHVNLREQTSPYNIIESAAVYLSNSGSGSIIFSNALNNTNYYLQVIHRNSVETWSNTGQLIFNNDAASYDFSLSANKAFGNNLRQIDNSPVKFGIYGGDVDQSGGVESPDLTIVDNGAFNFASGYVNSDVTGNGVVDAADLSIVDNNAFNFVIRIRP